LEEREKKISVHAEKMVSSQTERTRNLRPMTYVATSSRTAWSR